MPSEQHIICTYNKAIYNALNSTPHGHALSAYNDMYSGFNQYLLKRYVLSPHLKAEREGAHLSWSGSEFHNTAEACWKDLEPKVLSLYWGTVRRNLSAERRLLGG